MDENFCSCDFVYLPPLALMVLIQSIRSPKNWYPPFNTHNPISGPLPTSRQIFLANLSVLKDLKTQHEQSVPNKLVIPFGHLQTRKLYNKKTQLLISSPFPHFLSIFCTSITYWNRILQFSHYFLYSTEAYLSLISPFGIKTDSTSSS